VDNVAIKQIGEVLGLGAGGLLGVRVVWWLLSKVSFNGSDKIGALIRTQKATIEEITEDRATFITFLEEFSEIVSRVDNLESAYDDRRVDVDNSLNIGDSAMKKHNLRLDALESETKVINKAIAKLSQDNAVLIATIKPMQENITELKSSQDKMFDLVNNMNTNISVMMGKMSGI
jgi:chromosome segregation ATPase